MGNNLSSDYICISDYLMDPGSDLEEWEVIFKMASKGFAEIVHDAEDGEVSFWSTQKQIDTFMIQDIDDFIGYGG
jgi:hypothetical protein